MMIMEFAEKGSLRHVLSSDFNKILWKDKFLFLYKIAFDLASLHKLRYCHKDFQ